MFATFSNRLIPKPDSDKKNSNVINYFYQIHVSIQTFEEQRRKTPSSLKLEKTLIDFFKLEKDLLSACKEMQLLRPFENLLKLKINTIGDMRSASKSEYYHLYSQRETLSAYLNDILTVPEVFSSPSVIKFLYLPSNLTRRF